MTENSRVPELDLLRFCAAASVLLFHFDILMPRRAGFEQALHALDQFGFLGVPLFFMISGFVILWTAYNKSPREFVLARFSRLYPSYWVCVLVTSGVLALAGSPVPWKAIFANLTMVQHLFGFRSVDPVYWTLFVELKFYGLVLLLFLCGQRDRIERWLPVWLVLSAASLGAALWRTTPVPGLDTVVFEGSAAYFATGCYAYLIRMRGPSPGRWVGFGLGALLSVLAAMKFQHQYTYVYDWRTLLAVESLMLVALGAVLAIATRRWNLSGSRLWYWLGSLTYPLYLLHAIAGKTLYSLLPETWSVWSRITVALSAVLCVALLLAYSIEQHGCHAFYRRLSAIGRRVAGGAGQGAAVPAAVAAGLHRPALYGRLRGISFW